MTGEDLQLGARVGGGAQARRAQGAGADHVRLGAIAPDFQAGLDALERLAPVLTR
jgi:hypothetical protein